MVTWNILMQYTWYIYRVGAINHIHHPAKVILTQHLQIINIVHHFLETELRVKLHKVLLQEQN